MTDKEKEKEEHSQGHYLAEEREWRFIKRKEKKKAFLKTWSLRKKKKKRYACEPLFSWREEVDFFSCFVGERFFTVFTFFVFMSYLAYLHWYTYVTNWSDLPFVIINYFEF